MNHSGDFDAILGYSDIKLELAQIADILRHPEHYERFGATMPSGLLIEGDPGLGKTLMANCLIKASGLPAYTCRKDRTGQEMLEIIRTTFEMAKDDVPCIILIDDMDKFSNNPFNLRDTDEFVTLQTCIDDCKGEGVFIIATVNDADRMPDSLTREGRFDRTIRVEPPLGHDAYAIIEHYLQGRDVEFAVPTEEVVGIMEGHSCAFLETVINEASLMAGYEQAESIDQHHLVGAYTRVVTKGGLVAPRTADDAETLEAAGPSRRAQVAYHEAGHVVMCEAMRRGSVSIALVFQRHGRLAGVTKQGGREIEPETYEEVRNGLLVLLAGSAAVEMKFGIPCVGSSSDNERAFDLLKKLSQDTMFAGALHGASMRHDFERSDAYKDSIEVACGIGLEHFRWDVRHVLAKHAAQVTAVAERLYRDGYIMAADIKRIMDGEKPMSVIARAA